MLVKWSFQLGDPRRHDNYCADCCEVERLDADAIEVIGRTIIESMLLYAGAENYVDEHGNAQLIHAEAAVKISGFSDK